MPLKIAEWQPFWFPLIYIESIFYTDVCLLLHIVHIWFCQTYDLFYECKKLPFHNNVWGQSLSDTYKTAKINFINSRTTDKIWNSYYIRCLWCDEINFCCFICHSTMGNLPTDSCIGLTTVEQCSATALPVVWTSCSVQLSYQKTVADRLSQFVSENVSHFFCFTFVCELF